MPRSPSPLRYPGGKACLYKRIAAILRANKLERRRYVEPFAGGGGLALSLLYGGHVSDIHINDLDRAIWAFWHSALDHTDALVAKIEKTPITIEEWHSQRDVYRRADTSAPVDLGFAAFFLNRTNRSGIIGSGGLIGGFAQNGRYKLDCRFNRAELTRRVRRIAVYRDRIHLTGQDAREFIAASRGQLPEATFFFVDPPYFAKGASLYRNAYRSKDHENLSGDLLALENPWIVTYDAVPEIAALYRGRRQFPIDINYSAQRKRVGTELMIVSKGLKVPAQSTAREGAA
ncbi:MAG: DNA adenine methylase [Rhodospirillaceae bacterium]|nr:DNA adenine methylase [Rhodospirillaceae bacterium]